MVGLLGLASGIGSGTNSRTSNVAIIELDKDDKIANTATAALRFQYYPESLSDSKQVNYQRRDIPGASLPLYQWINSGERLLSFQAVFTSDVDLGVKASSNPTLIQRLSNVGQENRNVDIRSAIIWLRRFVLPTYSNSLVSDVGTLIAQAPRKLILVLSGSGVGLSGGGLEASASAKSGDDGITAIMTQCDVMYESFFPSGLPRIATVQLAFAQIAQLGGYIHFPGATDSMNAAVAQSGVRYYGYTVSQPIIPEGLTQ